MRSGKTGVDGKELHISGGEGLFSKKEIIDAVNSYIKRAMGHPRGKPDKITITIEEIREKPEKIPLLNVKTLDSESPSQAKELIKRILKNHDIRERIIEKALNHLYSCNNMRGAVLMDSMTGRRMEPDKERGVRASRLGIERRSLEKLEKYLDTIGINTITVKEALLLASKVASCQDIIAEICISDDPDYTTGYVASKKMGYQRIPFIKNKGNPSGGRIFFIRHGADIEKVISYLEKKPVIAFFKDDKSYHQKC